ncbi:uncharacterized protein LOC134275497, partial [Saccostrea cucullata]|uniref:uncharacterized protein LOC134275497 n=1 Tax=Saccostrea cuccullata TaxID=36930 RepID=UPI002ED3B973
MASMQLGYGATTLHHWAGILDGRYSCEELEELFLNDDKFAAARERIQSTEILIIDEISMLSKKIIDVCRLFLKKEMVFGGLQVIGCGDFKQLPPVPNYRYGDDGSYCIESNVFQKTFQHHINLTEVKRQNEPELVRAVTELCNGTPSEDTVQLLRSLDRTLPKNVEITRLYGTNFEINYINHECIEDENGLIFTYKAKNE